MKLVFIAPCVDEDFFLPVKQAAGEAAALLDVSVDFIGTQDVDVPAQIAMLRKAAAVYDGIALSIPDPAAFRPAISDVMDNGVPVVAFNIDDPQSRRLSAVCQDLYHAGVTLGERALPHLRPGAKVLFTLHSAGISALDARMKGMLDALCAREINYLTTVTGTIPATAASVISAQLDLEPDIQAILCTGQADTEGAGLAVCKRRQRGRYYLAGFDVSILIIDMIKTGVIDFTIDQQPYAQGFYPVVQLVLYLRKGIYPSNIDTGALIVDQSRLRFSGSD